MYDLRTVLAQCQVSTRVPIKSFKGYVLTTATGFKVYSVGQLDPVAVVPWTIGGSQAFHKTVVQFLADKFLDGGELREYRGTATPAGFERWGWTRESRGIGSCSVEVTHYSVWTQTDMFVEVRK